jgi:hypothetical protein
MARLFCSRASIGAREMADTHGKPLLARGGNEPLRVRDLDALAEAIADRLAPLQQRVAELENVVRNLVEASARRQ